ncbi:MAG: hypothetical protein KF851_07840 [Pirellulaceae bacterium]|nr:hypothetical protein [Pirellulaceae bacterium]
MTDFLRPCGQILVLEPTGKWRAALRKQPLPGNVHRETLLSLDELTGKLDGLPTLAILEISARKIPALTRQFGDRIWDRNLAVWIIGNDVAEFDDETCMAIERLGYHGVLTSLAQFPRWIKRAERFFLNAAPVELTLEERIELQFPWRKPSQLG